MTRRPARAGGTPARVPAPATVPRIHGHPRLRDQHLLTGVAAVAVRVDPVPKVAAVVGRGATLGRDRQVEQQARAVVVSAWATGVVPTLSRPASRVRTRADRRITVVLPTCAGRRLEGCAVGRGHAPTGGPTVSAEVFAVWRTVRTARAGRPVPRTRSGLATCTHTGCDVAHRGGSTVSAPPPAQRRST